MKRRGFIGLLGMAPALPLVAKELSKSAEPVLAPVAPAAADVWQLQPLDESKQPWRSLDPVTAACKELAHGELPYLCGPSEHTRMVELTATFRTPEKGVTLPVYSRVYFMGKPVLTMPTEVSGEVTGETLTIVQSIQIN